MNIAITINAGTHNGEVTAHHDQYCTGPISANLSTKNIKNNTPPTPIPLDVFLFSLIIFIFLLYIQYTKEEINLLFLLYF